VIIVAKIGTSSVTGTDGLVDVSAVRKLCGEVAVLRRAGHDVVIVTSGAVTAGVATLRPAGGRPADAISLQALSAIGQHRLMRVYDDALAAVGLLGGQVLLAPTDFGERRQYLHARATIGRLLAYGVVPIVNENDTVSTAELDRPAENPRAEKIFGDNDKLSALLMKHINADLLVLLSDVDGLFDRAPQEAGAQVISRIEEIDERILALADGGNGRGRGGMASKLESARIVLRAGKQVVIANGRTPHVLERIIAGEPLGTRFAPTLEEAAR